MAGQPPSVIQDDAEALTKHLCDAIDIWHTCHPEMSVQQILRALERIRYAVTEAWIAGERK